MTKRRPLEWYDTDFGMWPACDRCVEFLLTPGFREAVASVSIEHPTTADALAKRTLDAYHADRHDRSDPSA